MKALITGITGQDGSYLAEFLLGMDYEVHGLVRRSSTPNLSRITYLLDRIHLHYGDVTDGPGMVQLVSAILPDEVYHLAAQSYVGVSFDAPGHTVNTNVIGTINMLEAVRASVQHHPIRYYQASTSEMYATSTGPKNEYTPFRPRSPYGCSKLFGYWLTVNYREAYGLHACNGILFNHESPRRGEEFVTRKITRAATRIKLGLQDKLSLGSLDARRDWGFAGDYVRAMWGILRHTTASDFVVATGKDHSIRDFLQIAFDHLGLDYQRYVYYGAENKRPTDVDVHLGDARKAQGALGWRPSVSFEELVRMMVDSDLELARREKDLL